MKKRQEQGAPAAQHIAELQAGRELDALVAEKVMGWRWHRHGEVRGGWVHYASLLPPESTDHRVPVTSDDALLAKHERDTGLCPHYSTSIADAWLVVEKMGQTEMPGHVGPTMLHMLRACAGGQWEAQFCSDFGYSQTTRAGSAPLAICRAALAVLTERSEVTP